MHDRSAVSLWIAAVAAVMQFSAAAWVCTFAFNDARTVAYARSLYESGQAWPRFCDIYDVVDAELHTFLFVPTKRSPDALPLRQALIERDQVLNKLFALGGPEHIAPLREETSWRGFLLRYGLVELRPTAYGSLLEWRTWWEWLKTAGSPEGLLKLTLIVSLELLMACSGIMLLALVLSPLGLLEEEFEERRRPALLRIFARATLGLTCLLALPCLPIATAVAACAESNRKSLGGAFFACSASIVAFFAVVASLLLMCDAIDGLICYVCVHWLTPEFFQQAMSGLGPLSYWIYILLYYAINIFWAAFRLMAFIVKRLAFASIFIVGIVQFLLFGAVFSPTSDTGGPQVKSKPAAVSLNMSSSEFPRFDPVVGSKENREAST